MADLDFIPIAPGSLQNGVGEKLLFFLKLPINALVDTATEAVQARMPGKGTPTALPFIGADREIIRGYQEQDASYAVRCRIAFDSHRRQGLPDEVLRNVLGWTSPASMLVRHVSNAGRWDELAGTWLNPGAMTSAIYNPGAGVAPWVWDAAATASPPAWSRFWILLYPDPSIATRDGTWGDGSVWGDDGAWGSTWTQSQIELLRSTIREWKAAHATCTGILVVWNSTDLKPVAPSGPMPDGTWATYSKIDGGGASKPARNPNCSFFPGV